MPPPAGTRRRSAGAVISRIAPLLGVEPRFDLPPSERLILAKGALIALPQGKAGSRLSCRALAGHSMSHETRRITARGAAMPMPARRRSTSPASRRTAAP